MTSAPYSAIAAHAGADFTRIRLRTGFSKKHLSFSTSAQFFVDSTLKLRTPLRLFPVRCSIMPLEGVTTTTLTSESILLHCRAFWVNRSIIAWNVDIEDDACYLYASRDAKLSLTDDEIQGYDLKMKLEGGDDRLPEYLAKRFPHIRDYKTFKVPQPLDCENILKCQLAVAILTSDGKCKCATGLQLPGIIDELFSYTGPLGAVFSCQAISLYLWAPTATVVRAFIYRNLSDVHPFDIIELKETHGVWVATLSRDREGYYYAYEVCVYHHTTLQIEKSLTCDPYSRGLSADGKRTLLVDLECDYLKPEGWDNLGNEKPDVLSTSDISIYELHIRDFSANDHTVHPDFRGGYLAFTLQDSAGVLHLKRLSAAGITHIHLLPTFHFAGVDDEKHKWKHADIEKLKSFPPDSCEQQAIITAIQNEDGYNWGYNPVLWGIPKGSYASNPNGSCRVMEFRKMVQALNHIGFRVVLDVVYNHLHASGHNDENSVLDKIVPGYYLRRNNDGSIENSTCINNTASEHFMVERLILDDLMCWAVHYKVDGFRFDLMGHIMKKSMVKAKSLLQSLSMEKSGVDGPKIFLYGEGWDFGEVANNGRGVNASQFNLYGTGIGSFNDRIRDALLGGSPFGHPLQQGFATGLFVEPNGHDHGGSAASLHTLAVLKDHIQVGMAGNLKDFVLVNHDGEEAKGSEILSHDGTPVGYTSSPIETINYVSAHDNETLFDILSLKTSMYISIEERCRMNHLATSVIALSQGIPFFHSGDEILRSKSLDRDSYNSGDWFNRLDFSYNSNNWGAGLPPKEKNEQNWPLIKPRLADPSFEPQKSHIVAALENFCDLLKIRYSSPLFRLRTANAIQERVRFHNVGPSWVPGVVVMSLQDGFEGFPGLTQLDPKYSYIVTIINACPVEVLFTTPELCSKSLQLHPVQMNSSDAIVKKSTYDHSTGCFTVPARTTAVFVEHRIGL
ncbi:unnamed protein product [Cuscuta epithymum]|uniref:Pullulanase 1, chloroplastic n=1 Tax=Cuscuta epithymum TaxID=186058 RepID=A0AAV0DE33_9ASTE|nr:unnamed protein product [Cuscuta epithymum]